MRVWTSQHVVLHGVFAYVPEETASAVLYWVMVAIHVIYLNLNRVVMPVFERTDIFCRPFDGPPFLS